jgi:hypothetical protein
MKNRHKAGHSPTALAIIVTITIVIRQNLTRKAASLPWKD